MAGKPLQQLINELQASTSSMTFPEHSSEEPPSKLLVMEEEEVEEEACANCFFSYTEDGEMWFCRRYPGIQSTDPWWWCGDYEPEDDG